MRDYEAVYIFDSTLEESVINEKLERYHALITGDGGGQVTAVDHWGAPAAGVSDQRQAERLLRGDPFHDGGEPPAGVRAVVEAG